MSKILFASILLTAVLADVSISFGAEVGQDAILAEIEDSAANMMDLGSRLRTDLELSHYYDIVGKRDDARRVYDRLSASLSSASLHELATNSEYVEEVIDKLEHSKRRGLVEAAGRLRTDMISRSLNDAGNGTNQNNNMDALGAKEMGGLAAQLGRAPEFKELFQLAIKSFPTDRAELQSLSRVQNLAQLVLTNKHGFGPNQDNRARLESERSELKENLDFFESKQPKTEKDLLVISDLQSAINTIEKKIKNEIHNPDCWIDPRIPLDDVTLKSFTCASLAVAESENLDSKEAYEFLRTLSFTKPFSNLILDCRIHIRLQERKIAIAAANPPSACVIPEELYSAATFRNSGGLVGAMPPSEDTLPKTEKACSEYIHSLREFQDAEELGARLDNCEGSLEDGSCLLEVGNDASRLQDEFAIPIMIRVAQRLAILNSPEAFGSIQTVLSRFGSYSSSSDFSKASPSAVFQKFLDLGLLDSAFAQYISASSSGYENSIKLAEGVTDPGLKSLLLIHVVERFTEKEESGSKTGRPKIKFADGTLGGFNY